MIVQTVRPTSAFVSGFRETYVAKVKYMMGDADGYETIEEVMTAEQLVAFKNLLDNTQYNRDRGYRHGEFWEALVKAFGHDDLGELFANDPDGWGHGQLSSFSALWYNKDGVPHNVEFS